MVIEINVKMNKSHITIKTQTVRKTVITIYEERESNPQSPDTTATTVPLS